MARLKCKSCEKFFELNGSSDINCPNCGIKLENSFTEWKKQSGNRKKSFDDYKKKKCYPSAPNTHSATKYKSTDHHTSHQDDPYKKFYKSGNSKKSYQRRIYIISAISVFVLIATFTNPQPEVHRKAFYEKVFGQKPLPEFSVSTPIVQREAYVDESWKIEAIKLKINQNLTVVDCLLFSFTNVTWKGKTYNVGIGIFGHVYIADFVEKLRRGM